MVRRARQALRWIWQRPGLVSLGVFLASVVVTAGFVDLWYQSRHFPFCFVTMGAALLFLTPVGLAFFILVWAVLLTVVVSSPATRAARAWRATLLCAALPLPLLPRPDLACLLAGWAALLVVLVRRPGTRAARALRATLLCGSLGLLWHAPYLSPCAIVWAQEDRYLRSIDDAIAKGPAAQGASDERLLWIDFTQTPPGRAIVTWYSVRDGPWEGVLWDPDRRVELEEGPRLGSRRIWQHRHLWGPWYWARGGW